VDADLKNLPRDHESLATIVRLAEAGILDGRRAAMHWMHAPLLASRYPAVTVEPDAIFVRDGRIWSSAGVTSGMFRSHGAT